VLVPIGSQIQALLRRRLSCVVITYALTSGAPHTPPSPESDVA
jgi:hypothetical protein